MILNVTASPDIRPAISSRKRFLPTRRIFVRWLVIGVALLWSLAALTLLAARWIDPPTTAMWRRVICAVSLSMVRLPAC